MRVFVWKSYGNADVYYAEDSNDLRKIYMEMRNTMRDFYSPEEFVEIFGPEPDLLTIIKERNITDLIDCFGGESVHEIIEYGTGFTNVQGR